LIFQEKRKGRKTSLKDKHLFQKKDNQSLWIGCPFSIGGETNLSDNWIVANLENAFGTWNDKMTEIWSLITTSPQNFKGGAIWNIVTTINGGLQAIGYALLILFFAMSIRLDEY
jgi:hypothetical protein